MNNRNNLIDYATMLHNIARDTAEPTVPDEFISEYKLLENEYGAKGANELLEELINEGLGDPRSMAQITQDAAEKLIQQKREAARQRDLDGLKKQIDYVERALQQNKDISEIVQLLKSATGRAEEIMARENIRTSGATTLRRAAKFRGSAAAGNRLPDNIDFDDITRGVLDGIRKLRY